MSPLMNTIMDQARADAEGWTAALIAQARGHGRIETLDHCVRSLASCYRTLDNAIAIARAQGEL